MNEKAVAFKKKEQEQNSSELCSILLQLALSYMKVENYPKA